MRVLVLRPEPAASRTAATLAARGHETVLLPLSKAEHALDAVKTALAEPHAALAITSAEAARLLGRLGDGLTPHLATTVFAVGEASATAARTIGFANVLSANGDGEALAGLIAAHAARRDKSAQPILYLAGNPRAAGFETRLAATGIALHIVEAYRMVPLAPSRTETETALLQPVPDAVLLYSRQSAHAFFALPPLMEAAPGRFDAMRLLCMSANVAAAVPARFTGRIAVAATPDENGLLALL
ncbi:uroporphyrinogen-III synthase [Shinella sp. G-2]|uniref:uroporphyrinogen-III synthase n=1 Tax=Shinella sp. G-2 TaxID=3133141 RepID=UPI003D02FF02